MAPLPLPLPLQRSPKGVTPRSDSRFDADQTFSPRSNTPADSRSEAPTLVFSAKRLEQLINGPRRLAGLPNSLGSLAAQPFPAVLLELGDRPQAVGQAFGQAFASADAGQCPAGSVNTRLLLRDSAEERSNELVSGLLQAAWKMDPEVFGKGIVENANIMMKRLSGLSKSPILAIVAQDFTSRFLEPRSSVSDKVSQ